MGIPGKLARFGNFLSFGNFPSCGNLGNSRPKGDSRFLSAHISDFKLFFALESLFYGFFNYVYGLLSFVILIEISSFEEGGSPK